MLFRSWSRRVLLGGAQAIKGAKPIALCTKRSASWSAHGKVSIAKGNNSALKYAVAVGAAGLATFATFDKLQSDANIQDDAEHSVSVDSSVTPFPTKLGPPALPLSAEFTLLGYGFRSVTFLSFKVYALGIYIADQDRHLIPDVLDSKFMSTAFIDTDPSKSHSENVKKALDDPTKSTVLIGNVLDSGARMLAKLTPVRNTDFNHLRDGFIRTILNHPEAKDNQERLTAGLEELKKAFTEKGKVAKDDDLLVELQANGSLQFSYFNRKKDQVVTMGHVDEPLVGKFLFSQYMSGPKPLSPSARESVATRVAAMV